MLGAFRSCLHHDLTAMNRSRAQWLNPVIFFVMIVSLFGIALESQVDLVTWSPTIIWITFLLTALFTIESLFKSDQEEGIFEQLVLSPYPLWWLILAKSIAMWITCSLPLILVTPLLCVFLHVPGLDILKLMMSLFLGSPALILVGMIGATLTVVLPGSGLFLALLCLPLYVPILILGESTVAHAIFSQWPTFQLTVLSAISVLAITLAPHAIAGALTAAMDT